MMIKVETTIEAPIEKVWTYWTSPDHIMHWNFASDDWHCPSAQNNLFAGGDFNWRMEAKDGSMGFDFTGNYNTVKENKLIHYQISDGRKVEINFEEKDGGTMVSESFEPEDTHSDEMQRAGWQAILENFKRYVESN